MPLIAESMASLWVCTAFALLLHETADSQPCDIAHDRNAQKRKTQNRHSPPNCETCKV